MRRVVVISSFIGGIEGTIEERAFYRSAYSEKKDKRYDRARRERVIILSNLLSQFMY